MAIDISRFHGAFFEESKEHLNSLESLLLNLDLDKPDSEYLNAIFRAVHSIKGGSATFGFDDISELSHQLEGILDQLRKGQIKPEKQLINTLLQASDALKAMLFARIEQQPPNSNLASNIKQQISALKLTQPESNLAQSDAQAQEIDGFELFDLLDDFQDDAESTNNHAELLGDASHLSKDRLHAFDTESKSIRVNTDKIDTLVNLVGELVITESMLSEHLSALPPEMLQNAAHRLSQLQHNLREMQDAVMSMRMMPIGTLFSRFPRLVHDLSAKLNKEVDLQIYGEDTELDKNLIENIADPLMHLIRNSMDHGVESIDVRKSLNKPEKGLITLEASHQGGGILIEISDDGAGLNEARIIKIAKQRGMVIPESIGEDAIWDMISQPGFSTSETVTDISGRGVGVDVVNRNVTDLGGFIKLKNRPNQGCTFSIHLPLTLAIIDGMTVALGESLYVIPLNVILETLKPTAAQVKTIVGEGQMLHFREEYIPIIAMHKAFNLPSRNTQVEDGMIVVVESHGKKAALFLDDLIGQQQVVVKSLEANFRRINGISGATVLGNGTVAFIIDVPTITKLGQSMYVRQPHDTPRPLANHWN